MLKINKLLLSGVSATLIGNGIGRFGYITLMPVLIGQGWFTKAQAAQLGVATLIGYLFGPFFIQIVSKKIDAIPLLKMGMLLCTLSYLCCSIEALGFYWFYFWRLMAGFGGAILMILAAPTLLPLFNTNIRGKVSGVIFSGIGLGAALSGLIIPLLVLVSLSFTWLILGGLCLLLTLLTWNHWPKLEQTNSPEQSFRENSQVAYGKSLSPWRNKTIILLLLAYTFNAIGYLPHTLFWVDFLVRELDYSLVFGGISWALFGVGAALGPIITGRLGDAIGFKQSLLICFALKAIAVGLPLFNQSAIALNLSAFMVGLFTTGIITLISTFALALAGAKLHRRVWGGMTFAFALAQALGGFLMAYLISQRSSYFPLYGISAMCLCIAFLLILSMKHHRSITD